MSMTSRRNTTTTTTRYDAAAGTVRACRRGTRTLLWAGRPLLAVCFVSASVQKVVGTGYMVHLFGKIGAGQWLPYLIGVLEFAGAVGVLIPVLSGLAAAGLTALMAGATATNLLIGYNPGVPAGFLILSALVAWGRRRETVRLAARGHRCAPLTLTYLPAAQPAPAPNN